jgi:hypothetical protein
MHYQLDLAFSRMRAKIGEMEMLHRGTICSYPFFRSQKVSDFRKNLDSCPFSESLNIHAHTRGARKKAVVTGYCVYEKKKNREIKNPKQIKLKNGRAAVKGTCGSCGKPIFRIGKLK